MLITDRAESRFDRPARGLTRVEALAVSSGPLLLIATGRWGAYLRPPGSPFYVGDLLFLLGIAVLVLNLPARGWRKGNAGARVLLLVLPLVAWACLRFALGDEHGLLALRDAAGFVYALQAFLMAAASTAGYPLVLRWTWRALWVHAAWAVPSALGLLPDTLTRVQIAPDVQLFTLRSDFDGVVLGVTLVMLVHRALTRRQRRWWLPITAIAAALAQQQSRAALLGTLAALGILALLAGSASTGAQRLRAATKVAVAVPVLLAFVLALQSLAPANTGSIERLSVSIGLATPTSGEQLGALSTQSARISAWKMVLDYTSTYSAQISGVGFGPNYLMHSGAYLYLSGESDVRAPHNWLVNAYARSGVVGLVLWMLAFVVLAAWGLPRAVRVWRRTDRSSLDREGVLFPASLTAGLFVASLMGVILESPFGALPFYWCLGWLVNLPLDERLDTRGWPAKPHGTL